MSEDRSNGWEAAAAAFIRESRASTIGVAAVAAWAAALPAGACVLDLGCGPGTRRSAVLAERGFALHAVDAAPSMTNAYRSHFPHARVACEPLEESSFFGASFDGVLAWGVVFLLPEDTQRALVDRIGRALRPGGTLLFTAPRQRCTWDDVSTGRPSLSLGAKVYRSLLAEAGFTSITEFDDEGANHYYVASKP